MARYAIGRLYRPPKSDNTEHSSPNGREEDARSTLAGLEPMNFITVATPHLGSRGNKQVIQLPLTLAHSECTGIARIFVASQV